MRFSQMSLPLMFLFITLIIFPIFKYFLSVQRSMAALPESQRPLPPGSIWLSWVPLIGGVWYIGYICIMARALSLELHRRGAQSDGGLLLSIILGVLSFLMIGMYLTPDRPSVISRNAVGLLFLLCQFFHANKLSHIRHALGVQRR
jgi:hypothetical protein